MNDALKGIMIKKITAFAAVFMLIFSLAPRVYANSAEPPEMVIWSVNAPSDTEIVITYSDGGTNTVKKSLRLWEKCYFLYSSDCHRYTNDWVWVERVKITVKSSEKTFDLDMPERSANGTFSRVYTLDYNAQTLTENVSPLRAPVYMLLRLFFTLVIECGLYFIAGYREKRSYAAFVTVNIITQMFVNFVINGGSLDISYSYMTLVYLIMEGIVFLTEMIALPIAVKEKEQGFTRRTAFEVNFISMIIGGAALLVVPY